MTGSELDILAAKIAEKITVQPRFLKLKQAAEYASIGQKELIQLVKDRKIQGMQDLTKKTKPWIIDRKSLDQYRVKQIELFQDGTMDNEIALDIVESLNI